MTTTAKPTRRETFSLFRERGKSRSLVVELHATYMRVRLKGMRRAVTVSYQQVWRVGNENAARELRMERAARKRERKGEG